MMPPRIVNNDAFLMATGEGSRIEIHAADAAKESWTQLSQTAQQGDDELRFSEATGWEVGDRIAVASTDRSGENAEEFTIIGVSDDGRQVTIDRPVEFKHDGVVETYDNGLTGADRQEWDFDLRAEVALLSRNVKIQGDADSEIDHFGGHTMVMMGAEMHISGAEFENMGQEGILGRYPIHWHMEGDASGQYVQNSSVHGSFNKGITIHGTQNTWLEDNVVFDTIGHGFFFEDGSETGNVLVDNLAFGQTRNATEDLSTIDSDFFVPTSYWITNPNNHFVGNHAAGARSTGFWIFGNEAVTGASASDDRFSDIIPMDDVMGVFSGNTAHANSRGIRIGGTFDELSFDGFGRRGNDTVSAHLTEMQPPENGGANEVFDFQIDDFTAYDNDAGVWHRGFGGDYNNLMLADNHRGAFTRGLQSYNDSLIVGRSDQVDSDGGYEYDRYHGIHLYDESLEISGSHFAGFTGAMDGGVSQHVAVESSTHHNISGSSVEVGSRFLTNYNVLNDETNQQGTTISGIIDLDGSITGIVGATITPRLEQTSSGLDIVQSGFNAAPGAVYNADVGGWVNPAEAEIGILEFRGETQNPTQIWRSDQGHLRNLGSDMHADELIIIGGDVVDYTLDYGGYAGDNIISLGWHDVSEGTVVDFVLLGLPGSATFQNVNIVESLDELNSATVTSVYFDGQDHHVRLIATHFYYDPKQEDGLLDGANYSDFFQITLDGTRSSTSDSNPNTWYSGRPGNYHFQGAADDEDIDRELPDQAPSTSDTVTIQPQDNRWSDVGSWDNGMPNTDDIVILGEGQIMVLDQSTTVRAIVVNGGTLVVEDAQDIALSADWILVVNGGLFQVGSEENPFEHNFNLTLEGDNRNNEVDVVALVNDFSADIVRAVTLPGIPTEGDDQLRGTADDDLIEALGGSDLITTYSGSDRVHSGQGDDVVYLGGGDDYVRAGSGEESFYGGTGFDYVSYYDSRNGVRINLETNEMSGSWAWNDTISGFEGVAGSKTGDDEIIGTSGANVIKTFGGDDRVYAGRGDDRVELGSGNDYVRAGGGRESFDGGSGLDYINYGDSGIGVRIDLAADTISGGWGGNDMIRNFESAAGSAIGNDQLLGDDGVNTLRGLGGDDNLNGRGGNDRLFGGDGDDRLDGGQGTDNLYGGGGADRFHFDLGDGVDTVRDFQNNVDTIELDNFIFGVGVDAFDFAAQVGNDVVFTFDTGDVLTIEDTNIGALANDLILV